jgi:hypothetical protein
VEVFLDCITSFFTLLLIFSYLLPFNLYGCKTWSLTLKEEHRLMVFENRVLRRIFGLKRDDVTGDSLHVYIWVLGLGLLFSLWI